MNAPSNPRQKVENEQAMMDTNEGKEANLYRS